MFCQSSPCHVLPVSSPVPMNHPLYQWNTPCTNKLSYVLYTIPLSRATFPSVGGSHHQGEDLPSREIQRLIPSSLLLRHLLQLPRLCFKKHLQHLWFLVSFRSHDLLVAGSVMGGIVIKRWPSNGWCLPSLCAICFSARIDRRWFCLLIPALIL